MSTKKIPEDIRLEVGHPRNILTHFVKEIFNFLPLDDFNRDPKAYSNYSFKLEDATDANKDHSIPTSSKTPTGYITLDFLHKDGNARSAIKVKFAYTKEGLMTFINPYILIKFPGEHNATKKIDLPPVSLLIKFSKHDVLPVHMAFVKTVLNILKLRELSKVKG